MENIMYRIRDPILKMKMAALLSGMVGVMVASYGNAPRNGVSGPPIAPVAAPDITVSEPDFAEAPHSVVSTRRRR